MEYQRNVGIQIVKMKKNLWLSFVTVTYFLFTSVILLHFICLKISYLNIFFSKTNAPVIVKFHMKHDQTPEFQNYKIGSGQESKMATITKNNKNNKINLFSRTIRYNWL